MIISTGHLGFFDSNDGVVVDIRVFRIMRACPPLTYTDNYHRCKWVCHRLGHRDPDILVCGILCECVGQFAPVQLMNFCWYADLAQPVLRALYELVGTLNVWVPINTPIIKHKKMRSRHPLSDSTPPQDVRAAAEARGDATVRGTTTPKTKQQNLRFSAVGLAWMTIGTGISFFLTVDAYFTKRMLRATRMTSRVSLIGMPRPHPSLERFEMDLLGSLRPIRVDHTKFS